VAKCQIIFRKKTFVYALSIGVIVTVAKRMVSNIFLHPKAKKKPVGTNNRRDL